MFGVRPPYKSLASVALTCNPEDECKSQEPMQRTRHASGCTCPKSQANQASFHSGTTRTPSLTLPQTEAARHSLYVGQLSPTARVIKLTQQGYRCAHRGKAGTHALTF